MILGVALAPIAACQLFVDVADIELGPVDASLDVRGLADASADVFAPASDAAEPEGAPASHGGEDGDAGTSAGLTIGAMSDAEPVSSTTPPIALVQTAMPGFADAGISTDTTVIAGDLLVAVVYWPGHATDVAVGDSLANTWYHTPGQSNAAKTSAVQIFYSENAKGGFDRVTAHQSMGSTSLGLFLLEYQMRPVGHLDTESTTAPATDSNVIQAEPLDTSGPLDVIVAAFSDTCSNGVMLAGPGYIARRYDATFSAMVEDDLPAGVPEGGPFLPTAQLADGGHDTCWVAVAASFRAP